MSTPKDELEGERKHKAEGAAAAAGGGAGPDSGAASRAAAATDAAAVGSTQRSRTRLRDIPIIMQMRRFFPPGTNFDAFLDDVAVPPLTGRNLVGDMVDYTALPEDGASAAMAAMGGAKDRAMQRRGQTMACYAARKGLEKVLTALLEAGVSSVAQDPRSAPPVHHMTPLEQAVQSRQAGCVKILLKYTKPDDFYKQKFLLNFGGTYAELNVTPFDLCFVPYANLRHWEGPDNMSSFIEECFLPSDRPDSTRNVLDPKCRRELFGFVADHVLGPQRHAMAGIAARMSGGPARANPISMVNAYTDETELLSKISVLLPLAPKNVQFQFIEHVDAAKQELKEEALYKEWLRERAAEKLAAQRAARIAAQDPRLAATAAGEAAAKSKPHSGSKASTAAQPATAPTSGKKSEQHRRPEDEGMTTAFQTQTRGRDTTRGQGAGGGGGEAPPKPSDAARATVSDPHHPRSKSPKRSK